MQRRKNRPIFRTNCHFSIGLRWRTFSLNATKVSIGWHNNLTKSRYDDIIIFMIILNGCRPNEWLRWIRDLPFYICVHFQIVLPFFFFIVWVIKVFKKNMYKLSYLAIWKIWIVFQLCTVHQNTCRNLKWIIEISLEMKFNLFSICDWQYLPFISEKNWLKAKRREINCVSLANTNLSFRIIIFQ